MHRIGVTRNKKAALAIDLSVFKRKNLLDVIKGLKKEGFFDELIDIKLMHFHSLNKDFSEQEVIDYYNAAFYDCGYPLNKFNEIYVTNDSWDGEINLYFNLINRKYFWYELVPNTIHPIVDFLNPFIKKYAEKYKYLTPHAEYAIPCLLVESEKSKKIFHSKGYITWDINKTFKCLSENDVRKIAKCYGINELKLDDTENAVLVLKNSLGWSLRDYCVAHSKNTFLRASNGFNSNANAVDDILNDISANFDKIAIDFFCTKGKKIFVKRHPNDVILTKERLGRIYPPDTEDFVNIPFEFMAKLFEYNKIKFQSVLGYASTSLDSLPKTISKNIVILGKEYYENWFFYCSLYVTLLFAKENNIKKILCNSTLKTQVEKLIECINYKVSVDTAKFADPNSFAREKDCMIIFDCIKEGQYVNNALPKTANTNIFALLNADISETFFADTQTAIFGFVPKMVKKIKKSDSTLNLERDELVWFYTPSRTLKDRALAFECSKDMPVSGYEISVEGVTVPEAALMFKEQTYKYRIKKLEELCSKLERDFTISKYSKQKVLQIIKDEKDIKKYLKYLEIIKDDYLIMLAVRDTPGDCIDNEILGHIHDLGFTKFTKGLWYMYCGLLLKSIPVCDIVGAQREEAVNYNISINNLEIKLSSNAWRRENKAEIIINDKDYAVNIRGINIVVYDLKNNNLIDAVGFDCHTTQMTCKRLNNSSNKKESICLLKL